MIGTVIVPIDGSDLAAEAIPYGQTIAERVGASLHLVQVVPVDASHQTERQAHDDLRRWQNQSDDRVQTSIRKGDPADRIIAASEEMVDPIIVMTTHGRSGVGRWLYGSVADRVVRGAGIPVLLIRSGTVSTEPSAIRSILLPLDGSSHGEFAIPFARELARSFDTRIHLVRVAETAQIYAMTQREPMAPMAIETLDELSGRMIEESDQYLAKIAKDLRTEGVDVDTQTLEGFPTDQLLAFEGDTDTDLIVMSTHARSGLSRMVFGSVAERVLKAGTTPVMMIKPPEEGENDDRDEMLIT